MAEAGRATNPNRQKSTQESESCANSHWRLIFNRPDRSKRFQQQAAAASIAGDARHKTAAEHPLICPMSLFQRPDNSRREETSFMKELVQYLAKSLVSNPEAVEVKETQGETASVLELKVAKEDLGRIIGKQGRTAKSIRTILNAAASRANRKVVLEIVEEK
jgi:predicted RNA-binding protein YlqC (UPF0109 family)